MPSQRKRPRCGASEPSDGAIGPGAATFAGSGAGAGADLHEDLPTPGLKVRVKVPRSMLPYKWRDPPPFQSMLCRLDCAATPLTQTPPRSTADVPGLSDIVSMACSMDLASEPVNGDSWLSSPLIDFVSMQFASVYDRVHFLPCEFLAYSLPHAARQHGSLAAFRPIDLQGRTVCFPSPPPPLEVSKQVHADSVPSSKRFSSDSARSALASAALAVAPCHELQRDHAPFSVASRLSCVHATWSSAESEEASVNSGWHLCLTMTRRMRAFDAWPLSNEEAPTERQQLAWWHQPRFRKAARALSALVGTFERVQHALPPPLTSEALRSIEHRAFTPRIVLTPMTGDSASSWRVSFPPSLRDMSIAWEQHEAFRTRSALESVAGRAPAQQSCAASAENRMFALETLLRPRPKAVPSSHTCVTLTQVHQSKPIVCFANVGNNHWNLIRIRFDPYPSIEVFEPMGKPGTRRTGLSMRSVPRQLLLWLDAAYPIPDGWQNVTVSAIHARQQHTGFDCGVACLLYAEKCAQLQHREDIAAWTDQAEITQYRRHLQAFFKALSGG